jgi:hypothetical protein
MKMMKKISKGGCRETRIGKRDQPLTTTAKVRVDSAFDGVLPKQGITKSKGEAEAKEQKDEK